MKTLKLSAGLFIGMSAALALIFSVTVHQAEAYSNILVDRNLTVGSTGEGVVALQSLLSELGYLQVPTGVAFGTFGPLTKSAVAKYQVAAGVSPAAGYFGPLTKISMHQMLESRGWLLAMGW